MPVTELYFVVTLCNVLRHQRIVEANKSLSGPHLQRRLRLHEEIGVRRLLVTTNVIPSSPIPVTLMMKALSSSETSVLTRVTRRNMPVDGILHSHRRENLK
jgi:hypothetical protein